MFSGGDSARGVQTGSGSGTHAGPGSGDGSGRGVWKVSLCREGATVGSATGSGVGEGSGSTVRVTVTLWWSMVGWCRLRWVRTLVTASSRTGTKRTSPLLSARSQPFCFLRAVTETP